MARVGGTRQHPPPPPLPPPPPCPSARGVGGDRGREGEAAPLLRHTLAHPDAPRLLQAPSPLSHLSRTHLAPRLPHNTHGTADRWTRRRTRGDPPPRRSPFSLTLLTLTCVPSGPRTADREGAAGGREEEEEEGAAALLLLVVVVPLVPPLRPLFPSPHTPLSDQSSHSTTRGTRSNPDPLAQAAGHTPHSLSLSHSHSLSLSPRPGYNRGGEGGREGRGKAPGQAPPSTPPRPPAL